MELPGVLSTIANVAGEDAALAVADARGGTQIYVPPAPDADHWLSKLIGVKAAKAVAEELTCGFAGVRIDVPLGPNGPYLQRQATVDRMLREGRSERDIALATGYSMRQVRRRRANIMPAHDDRQLDLFS
jgi:hypothetical protein